MAGRNGDTANGQTYHVVLNVRVKKPTKAQKKITKVMREYKGGTLHSGKGGPVVKSRKQAVAIALSSAGKSKKKKRG
jgi:ribosomal protein L21E